jgi:ribonuclease R
VKNDMKKKTEQRAPAPGRAGRASPPSAEILGRLKINPGGFGFVVREDGLDDVFIGSRGLGLALDGDRVAISTWPGPKGTEGKVERIAERGRRQLVGVAKKTGRTLALIPDDPRIAATASFIRLRGEAPLGQVVVAEITRYPQHADGAIEAEVRRVLGEPEDLLVEVEKAIVMGEIPDEFPDDVAAAGDRAPHEVRREDHQGREDLRHLPFLTIDPETARDFDDAVAIEASPKGPGWDRLWVAVADVSHYVRPGSPLDHEARARGCSVYLPNRAIPMLPEPLSSGICSLNPGVERLAMVARVEVGPDGRTADPHFCAAIIRSRGRLDYPGVAAALAGTQRPGGDQYVPWLPALRRMREISLRLRALRSQRGSLDFDLPEAKIVLDDDDPRRVRDVVRSRGDEAVKGAYQMIEDFMLAANEAVAARFTARKQDVVWRVHDVPSTERLSQLAALVESYGMRFDPEEGKSPRRLRDFLEKLKGKPAETALNMMTLRALKQAQYDVVNVGHFGLAARDYVHFTSPIRRYPDLLVHRLLKRSLADDGGAAGGPAPPPLSRETLTELAAESSANERRAMEVEREVVDLYRAALMRDRVGEILDGRVASVTSFGLFVQIDHPFVEGLVKITTLPGDFFEFDDEKLRLVGRSSGRAYTLGMLIRVRVENVSIARRQIDLRPAEVRAAEQEEAAIDAYARAPLPPRAPTQRAGKGSIRGRLAVSGGKGRARLKVSGHGGRSEPEWVKDKRGGGGHKKGGGKKAGKRRR